MAPAPLSVPATAPRATAHQRCPDRCQPDARRWWLALLVPGLLWLGSVRAADPAGDPLADRLATHLCLGEPSAAAAPDPPFRDWVAAFAHAARDCGISTTAVAALEGVTWQAQVARLDRNQPEYNSTFSGYLGRRIGAATLRQGQALRATHAALLANLEARYGVPAEILLALWAMESGFGANIGTTPILDALATLAYEGRRRDLYRRELLAALRILERGEATTLIGSWAGAMGQVQFMPSTFLAYAVDGSGDGRRDIWRSVPDALASAAHYLHRLGWQRDAPWLLEVELPADFDPYPAELDLPIASADWIAAGVRLAGGAPLPGQPAQAAMVLPAGMQGPAFLVYDNFHVLLEWNRSLFFGLAAGQLARELAGGPALVGSQPASEQPLRRAEVMALQQALNQLGFAAGPVDGMVGLGTRRALRAWQACHGLRADAWPTLALITRIHAQVPAATPAAAGIEQSAALPPR
ncbi:MAG: lytic murein transglycosylase [Chromatiaceae bacterium]|nr:MAG: lytic murein transglycosylase [Chromatiaceae bacterium]